MISLSPDLWLVLEDVDDDFFLLRRACSFALASLPVLHRVNEAQAAKAFLMKSVIQPAVIIAKLHCSPLSCLELAAWIRREAQFNGVCFVLLTEAEVDMNMDVSQRALLNAVRIKPRDMLGWARLVDELHKEAAKWNVARPSN